MKGIILAGGTGSRLAPLTSAMSKHLLPVYDKPMIYYSLSTLMFAGIKDIAIISTPENLPQYEDLLSNGAQLGVNIQYIVQNKPNGIAEAFILAEDFIAKQSVCLILGDNILYGDGLPKLLQHHAKIQEGAVIFAYPVQDPKQFGVVSFDKDHRVESIEEKPKHPKSDFAITGLYFYDNNVVNFAKTLQPSKRGELEITDLNQCYLNTNNLEVELLGRGYAWLDAGTPESLFEANQFVQVIESRQGFKMACIEEIAFRMGFIGIEQFANLAEGYPGCHYGDYLKKILLREQLCAKY